MTLGSYLSNERIFISKFPSRCRLRSLLFQRRVMATASKIEKVERDPIVQYVVVRRDLWKDLQWPLGSVIAQACHASAAVLWLHRDDSDTKEYLNELDSMTKASFKDFIQTWFVPKGGFGD